jgi:hypothetical protein
MSGEDQPIGNVYGAWARRMRRSWGAGRRVDDLPPRDTETEVERLTRELLDARRKVVARDIEIAELQARLGAD